MNRAVFALLLFFASCAAASERAPDPFVSAKQSLLYAQPESSIETFPRQPQKKWSVIYSLDGTGTFSQTFFEPFLSIMNSFKRSERTQKITHVAADLALENAGRRIVYFDPTALTNDSIIKTIYSSPENTVGSYRETAKFLAFAYNQFPAEHHVFYLTGHGCGWSLGTAFNRQTGESILPSQLRLIMEHAGLGPSKKLDILVLNSCLMQTIETNYELADYVDYIVGSSNITYWSSANVPLFIKPNDVSATASAIAEDMIYQHTLRRLTEEPASISVIKSENLKLFIQNLKINTNKLISIYQSDALSKQEKLQIAKAVRQTLKKTVRMASITTDKRERLYRPGDLYDFLVNMGQELSSITIADRVLRSGLDQIITKFSLRLPEELGRNVMTESLQYQDFSTGNSAANIIASKGLSIELPSPFIDAQDKLPEGYMRLKFAQESGWPDFYKWLIKTRNTTNIPY